MKSSTCYLGEYSIVLTEEPKWDFYATKNGQRWRELSGDQLMLAAFYRIAELQEEVEKLQYDLEQERSGEL
jgi:hypothetical protein